MLNWCRIRWKYVKYWSLQNLDFCDTTRAKIDFHKIQGSRKSIEPKIRCKTDAQKSRKNRRQNGSQNEGKCVQKSIWSRHWAPNSRFWRLLELCKNMMNFWCVSGGLQIEESCPEMRPGGANSTAARRQWVGSVCSGPLGGHARDQKLGTRNKKLGFSEKETRLFKGI